MLCQPGLGEEPSWRFCSAAEGRMRCGSQRGVSKFNALSVQSSTGLNLTRVLGIIL